MDSKIEWLSKARDYVYKATLCIQGTTAKGCILTEKTGDVDLDAVLDKLNSALNGLHDYVPSLKGITLTGINLKDED